MIKLKIAPPIAVGLGLLTAACAGEGDATATNNAKQSIALENASPGKPRASVNFKGALRAPVSPGENGVLQVEILDGYNEGAMKLSAAGSDGLVVFSTSKTASFSMANNGARRWDIHFSAPEEDGDFYIDIVGLVEDPLAGASAISHSFAVKIGKGGKSYRSPAKVTMDADGEALVIMDAQESIIDHE